MKRLMVALGKIGKGIAFVLIFLALGEMIMSVMFFKQEDGTLPVHNFYSLPKDTVDVLVLGTSHAGMNVSTKTMWDEYGIAGYRYWGSIQPIWNTYYYLLDALKYQSPKVVLMDAHSLTFQQEYGTYPVQVKNTIAMRLSKEKIENIWASVPPEDRAFMIFGFPTYHNRYNQLTQEDFEYFPWDKHQEIQVLSSEVTDYIYAFSILDKDASEGEAPLGEKEEKYFRMLLEYCRDNQIHLELVASPYEISAIEQQKFRRVRSIAAEYGVDFTNYNDCYQEYGIDPQQDFLDPGHFNKTGMPKYARALAEMLKSKYDLPDRRQDPNHIWNQVRAEVNEPVFALTEQYKLDGRLDYYDTGMKLYENPLASWTLCADFSLPPAGDGSHTALACFDNVSGRGGLRVSREANGDLSISYAANMTARIQNPPEEIRLCVIKMGQQTKIFVNQELIENRKLSQDTLTQYDGTLLLGCEVGDGGRRINFGKTLIRDLVIYDTALNESDALAWEPKELPLVESAEYMNAVTEDDLILSLRNRFEGNGETYVDTGEKLFADPEMSFTLLCRIDPQVEGYETVYFSCFSEEPGAYRGLLARKIGDNLNIVYGDGFGLNIPMPQDQPSILAIVKDRSAYTVYLNGEKAVDQSVSVCLPYDGTFLIGCQVDENGNIFRTSSTTVYNLDVYRGQMTEEQILAWNPEPLAAVPRDPGMDVTYSLPYSFAGNKTDAYVDTGLMLYDNGEKNWTITFTLDRVTVRRGSILSCFDETPGKYRGLIVRQTDDTKFSFITGTEYTEIEIHPADTVTLSVVKDHNHYRMYVNGELAAEKESKIAPYLGNLLIGCERTQYGRPFRFSDISVRRLEVVNQALTDDMIQAQWQAWKETQK